MYVEMDVCFIYQIECTVQEWESESIKMYSEDVYSVWNFVPRTEELLRTYPYLLSQCVKVIGPYVVMRLRRKVGGSAHHWGSGRVAGLRSSCSCFASVQCHGEPSAARQRHTSGPSSGHLEHFQAREHM